MKMVRSLSTLMLLASPLSAAAAAAAASGFRVDVHAGLDHIRSDGEGTDGAAYGLALGYDLERGKALLGLEVDLDASDTKECESDLLVAGDRACAKALRDNSIVARAGVLIGERSAVYALAGYANARFRATYRSGAIRESEGETVGGLRVGGGVRIGLSSRSYAKLEYRYTDYAEGFTRHQGLVGIGLIF